MASTPSPADGSRSLILDHYAWAKIGRGFAVIALAGLVMLTLNVRAIRAYD